MKLITTANGTGTDLGTVQGSDVLPFSFEGGMLGLIQAGEQGLRAAGKSTGAKVPLENVPLTAPLLNPSKIMAIGLNYVDHATEGKVEPPKNPLLFAKFPSSLIGPGATIVWSSELTKQVDFESELVVIMGKTARNVSEADALDYVFGYTCGNDISARDLQFSDGQWVRSKSLDSFAPLGPWIVTADEIPNPQALAIRSYVNGQVMQDGYTGDMLFRVAYLIHCLSRSFTLLPGDLIFSGTPSGVGAFRSPPIFLGDGDKVTVEIENIGRLENDCRVSGV